MSTLSCWVVMILFAGLAAAAVTLSPALLGPLSVALLAATLIWIIFGRPES